MQTSTEGTPAIDARAVTKLFGKTDVVVSPRAGLLPDRAVQDARATAGVRDAGGMVGAIVTRLDQPSGWLQVSVSAHDRRATGDVLARLREWLAAGDRP